MQSLNEFRLVGKITKIGQLYTYPTGKQVVMVEVQTDIDNEIMKHSVSFFDKLAHGILNNALVGQAINIDGSLLAIEHQNNGKTETYFGLQAKRFYMLSIVQVSKHAEPENIPPLPQAKPQQAQPRPTTQAHKQRYNAPNKQTTRPQAQNKLQQAQPKQQPVKQAQQPVQQTAPQQAPVQQTSPVQQPQVQAQHYDNWADDLDFQYTGHDQSAQQAQPQKEHVLVLQEIVPQEKTQMQNAVIAGVKIDPSLPFNNKR